MEKITLSPEVIEEVTAEIRGRLSRDPLLTVAERHGMDSRAFFLAWVNGGMPGYRRRGFLSQLFLQVWGSVFPVPRLHHN